MTDTTKAAIFTGALIYTAFILSWLLLTPQAHAMAWVYPSIGHAAGVAL